MMWDWEIVHLTQLQIILESFFPFLNLKMTTLCQAPQLSKCSTSGGDSTRRLKQVMKDVLKLENKVNGDV